MAIRKFNPNSRPRGKLKHYGTNPSYHLGTKRIDQRLALYESVAIYDSTISSILNLLAESLVSSLGEIEHPDEEVKEFLRDNIRHMENNYQVNPFQELKQIIKTTLWAGFSTTEVLYEVVDEQLMIKGFAKYHPHTITIRTNKKGQLTENEPTNDPGFTSGIWQRYQGVHFGKRPKLGEVKLPMFKTVHLTYSQEFNNYYGRSVIESSYRWHVIKESLLDMFLVSQDQHGNPITVMFVPNTNSGEMIIDPETGEEKPLSVMKSLEYQISNTSNQDGNFIFIPFTHSDLKPEVKLLSTSNDVSEGYLRSLRYCDEQIIKSMLVPQTLVNSGEVTNSELAERDMEMFNRTLTSLYNSLVVPFVIKSFGFLVKENFGEEKAKVMPTIPLRNIMRPEDRVSMMQFIRGLTELTYLNPSNSTDYHMVRSWVGAIEREWSKEDADFFKKFLLEPRQPSSGSSANATPKNAESRSSTRDRSSEGNKKGTGSPGRPTGQPTPNIRDKQKQSNTKTDT